MEFVSLFVFLNFVILFLCISFLALYLMRKTESLSERVPVLSLKRFKMLYD